MRIFPRPVSYVKQDYGNSKGVGGNTRDEKFVEVKERCKKKWINIDTNPESAQER